MLVIIGKEKYDLQRRPKTGGGPSPVFSAAEEIMVGQLMCGNKAELTGLPSGLDTDGNTLCYFIYIISVLSQRWSHDSSWIFGIDSNSHYKWTSWPWPVQKCGIACLWHVSDLNNFKHTKIKNPVFWTMEKNELRYEINAHQTMIQQNC